MPQWQVSSIGKSECLTQAIAMQLYPKFESISTFFSKYLKSTSNFQDFEKRDEPHSWFFDQIIDCKKRGYLNA